jgi:hypothetical protein
LNVVEPPEDAAEEAEDAARVVRGERETAEKQAEVVSVGRLHGARRVAGGLHGLFNDPGQQIKTAGCCSGSD